MPGRFVLVDWIRSVEHLFRCELELVARSPPSEPSWCFLSQNGLGTSLPMDDQLRCCTSSNTLSLVNFSTKSVTGVTRPTQLRRRRTTKLRVVRGDKQTVTRDVRKVNKYGHGRNKQQAGYCTGRNVSKKYFRRKLIHAIIPSSESEGLQVISDSH